MFYVEKLFSFLRQHFLQNSLFGFRQLPQLQKLTTMVDLECPPPHSATTSSHHKLSCHNSNQVGCFFLLQIVPCLLCLLNFGFSFCFVMIVIVCAQSLTGRFFLSFTPFLVGSWLLLALSILRAPWCWAPPWFFSLGPISWPLRCSLVPSSSSPR
jgi:hypothetical protein